MEKQNTSAFDRFSNWINGSISIKMATIGFLVLILMIPLTMIDSVINERSWRKQAVINEISESWSSAQVINGPILTIPYKTQTTTIDYNGKENTVYSEHYFHLLPEQLNISAPINHETRKRGIYEVTVYDTDLSINGNFKKPDIDIRNLESILWDEAFITIGMSDMKGIQDEIQLAFNQSNLTVEPGSMIPEIIRTGITASGLGLHSIKSEQSILFNIDLSIRGSKQLQFIPLGKVTSVNISSTWPDPSFIGEYISTANEVSDDGFTANWKILHLNRNYPQSWIDNTYTDQLENSAFGVQLFTSADDYQAVTRASKYGMMTIALTFLVFFLVEIMNKKRIHPLQYILVGLGLSLFYVLLVSITEHGGFTVAYLVASSAIIVMIFLYSFAIFRDSKLSFGLLAIMIAVYSFVFVTLQLVDYALLIGSIGLTLTLAITMYLTRNIDWFDISRSDNTAIHLS